MRDLLAATRHPRSSAVANPCHFRNSREVLQFCHCPGGPERFELRPSCQFRTLSFLRLVCDRKSQRGAFLFSRDEVYLGRGEIIRDCHFARRGRFYASRSLKCEVKRYLSYSIKFAIDLFYIKLWIIKNAFKYFTIFNTIIYLRYIIAIQNLMLVFF